MKPRLEPQDEKEIINREDASIRTSDSDAIVMEVPWPSFHAGDPPGTPRTPRTPLLVVLAGPSGAGKDAVLDEMARLGHEFHRVVTCTTRPPRKNEQNGVDYQFVTEGEFDRLVDTGCLFEHALVYSHRSGVPSQQLFEQLKHGVDVIVRTDVNGAATIKGRALGAVLVFIAPASLSELEQRIRARGSDDEDDVQCRLRNAVSEMARRDECDYVVVNVPGQLNETATHVSEILEWERLQPRATLT